MVSSWFSSCIALMGQDCCLPLYYGKCVTGHCLMVLSDCFKNVWKVDYSLHNVYNFRENGTDLYKNLCGYYTVESRYNESVGTGTFSPNSRILFISILIQKYISLFGDSQNCCYKEVLVISVLVIHGFHCIDNYEMKCDDIERNKNYI
jgi:hypothetical protein